jgi:hypothetical protein
MSKCDFCEISNSKNIHKTKLKLKKRDISKIEKGAWKAKFNQKKV